MRRVTPPLPSLSPSPKPSTVQHVSLISRPFARGGEGAPGTRPTSRGREVLYSKREEWVSRWMLLSGSIRAREKNHLQMNKHRRVFASAI